jgi:hypothetical protein
MCIRQPPRNAKKALQISSKHKGHDPEKKKGGMVKIRGEGYVTVVSFFFSRECAGWKHKRDSGIKEVGRTRSVQ